MDTLLIGLGYKARHGKDTIATEMLCNYPRDVRVYSFAAALKAVARVLGMVGKDGALLQALGTDVFRRINGDIWVNVLEQQILEEKPRIAVISDMRFLNEKKWVENNGISVGVFRFVSQPNGKLWISPDRPERHQSEIELDGEDFDLTVHAKSGDMDTLHYAAGFAFQCARSYFERQDKSKFSGQIITGLNGRTEVGWRGGCPRR